MLNDDLADRTLPPTERHRREARLRGEVARSSELTAAAILLTTSCVLWYLAPATLNAFVTLMRNGLTAPPVSSFSIESSSQLTQTAVRAMGTILWPIFLFILISGLIANLAQTGWLWNPVAVLPRFRGGRLISWGQVGEAIGRILQLAVLGGVTWRFLMTHEWQLRSVGLDDPASMLVQPARMLGELSFQLSLSLIVIALVDYGVRFWRHEQRLKMTIEERRREQRDDGTNSQIKHQCASLGSRATSALTINAIDDVLSRE